MQEPTRHCDLLGHLFNWNNEFHHASEHEKHREQNLHYPKQHIQLATGSFRCDGFHTYLSSCGVGHLCRGNNHLVPHQYVERPRARSTGLDSFCGLFNQGGGLRVVWFRPSPGPPMLPSKKNSVKNRSVEDRIHTYAPPCKETSIVMDAVLLLGQRKKRKTVDQPPAISFHIG